MHFGLQNSLLGSLLSLFCGPLSLLGFACCKLCGFALSYRHKLLNYRDCECCGLACSGACNTENILACHNHRNSLLLDGGWLFVALLFDGSQYWVNDVEFLECHIFCYNSFFTNLNSL